MNERIRELAEQARLGRGPEKIHISENGVVIFYLNELEKFAELIVAECLRKIESQRSNGENADQWTITRDLCYHNMMVELKQHFGVEE